MAQRDLKTKGVLALVPFFEGCGSAGQRIVLGIILLFALAVCNAASAAAQSQAEPPAANSHSFYATSGGGGSVATGTASQMTAPGVVVCTGVNWYQKGRWSFPLSFLMSANNVPDAVIH
jgi:hypothetical protein